MDFDWTLDARGLRLLRDGRTVLTGGEDWLELVTDQGPQAVQWTDRAGDLCATAGSVRLDASAEPQAGTAADLLAVTLRVTNISEQAASFALKWTLSLSAEGTPRWLLPGLLYDQNRQQLYTGLPSLAGEENLDEFRSPYWVFRADLMAVPMVMAWAGEDALAMVMTETQAGRMNALGCDQRTSPATMIGAWPVREEPRPRGDMPGEDRSGPRVDLASLAPGRQVEITFYLRADNADPYAFNPILRETFARWDESAGLNPWFPTDQTAHHAAYGLFRWHCDKNEPCLWETAAFEAYYAQGEGYIDRYDMHTGFVSGTPCAQPLRQYALREGREDIAEKARTIIDFCCENLTPFGLFWSKYSREFGWTTGWPAPQRPVPPDRPDAPSGELHARSIADATLFTAKAARDESHDASRDLWTRAVRSNLDSICHLQREDGNVGQAYRATDGAVLDWDGEEGLYWIAALVEGYRLTGEDKYLQAARKAGDWYAAAVERADMTGAPEAMHLLPTSEDPQNGVIAYVQLYEATGETRWLELATRSAELLMTYRWQYNTDFDPLTILGAYDVRTKGLDVSSPNNIHLHPYGLACVPELVRLWEAIGDTYLIRQTRNNLLACHQMLMPVHGAMDGMRGMMTERYCATDCSPGKGGTLPVSHAWCIGLMLYAGLFLDDYGQLMLDGESRALTSLEALEVTEHRDRWTVHNPWPTDLDRTVVIRRGRGRLLVDHRAIPLADEPVQRVSLHLPAASSVTLRIDH